MSQKTSRLQKLRKCMANNLEKTSGEGVKRAMQKPLHATGQNMQDVYKKIPGSESVLTNQYDSSDPNQKKALASVIKRFRGLYMWGKKPSWLFIANIIVNNRRNVYE